MTANVLTFVGPTHHDGKESANSYQHRVALRALPYASPFAAALAKMLTGWEQYAEAHKDRYGESVGKDHVMGDYWAEVGLAIKRLLDGDCGGFDCGSIAHNITQAITDAGIPNDGYAITDREAK